MSKFVEKTLYALLTLFAAITVIFFVIRLSPGDPIETILGLRASPEEIERLKHQLGLDLPLSKQYFNYLHSLLNIDLGKSLFTQKSVLELLKERMWPTAMLAIFSIILSTGTGVIGGLFSGFYKNKAIDHGVRFFSLIALSFPIFSLAPILVYVFAIKLNLLPVSEWGEMKHIFLPVMTLVIPLSSVIMRVTRNKYLEEYRSAWVIVLKSKGLSDFSIAMRILKNCLPSVLNVVAIQLSVVLAGTMITENIYDIPGMGSLLFDGIQNRDYPVVQGVIVYSTTIYMLVYFLIDLVNEYIDPRLKDLV